MKAPTIPSPRTMTRRSTKGEIDCATCELLSGREAAEFRQAVDHAHEGLALTDAAGCYLYLNVEHARLFGYDDASQLLGHSWRTLYSDEVAKHIETTVFPLLHAHGHWHGTVQARRKDGSTFCQELTLSLLPGGRLVCNCRDCSEELAVKRELAQRDELFDAFLNNLPIGVLIRRVGGGYEFVNDYVARFTGFGKSELLGQDMIPNFSDAVNKNLRSIDEELCLTGEKRDFEISLPHAGATSYLRVIKFPIYRGAKVPTHICTVVQDITAIRKLAEEERSLSQQRQELIELQRQFISTISHEFRTPLTAIKGAQYLLEKRAGQLPEASERELKRILTLQQQSVATLGELVDQVLLINRLDHISHAPAALIATDVPALIQRIALAFNEPLASTRVQVELNVPSGWQAPAVEPLLRSAIENLVSNALKYSPPNEQVSLSLRAAQESWLISVTDRGRGIPLEEQPNIFEPFFRASNVGSVSGTGLGLNIVQRIAAIHGGHVSFTSEPGKGTCFTFTVPAATPTSQ